MKNKKDYDKKHAEKMALKYGLIPNLHWWPHKQSGKFILTHDAVQIIADSENITFEEPKVNWDNLPNIALMVVGHLGDRTEWSFGECNPKNSFNPYPWAMAEKRAKDRVTLKLIGAYKMGVSSEVEAEAFSEKTKVVLNDDDGSGLESPKQALNKRKDKKAVNDTENIKTTQESNFKLDQQLDKAIKKDDEKDARQIRDGINKLEETKAWFLRAGDEHAFNSILMLSTGGLTDIKEVSKQFDVEEILKPLRDSYRQLTTKEN